jgi:hypothetical protein
MVVELVCDGAGICEYLHDGVDAGAVSVVASMFVLMLLLKVFICTWQAGSRPQFVQ